jgi:hypothetical protein
VVVDDHHVHGGTVLSSGTDVQSLHVTPTNRPRPALLTDRTNGGARDPRC